MDIAWEDWKQQTRPATAAIYAAHADYNRLAHRSAAFAAFIQAARTEADLRSRMLEAGGSAPEEYYLPQDYWLAEWLFDRLSRPEPPPVVRAPR